MIVSGNDWFDIVPSSGVNREIHGKWLIFGPTDQLHARREALDQMVEAGELKAAKIARKLPQYDPFPERPCVICIFTADDPAEKTVVKALIQERLGLIPSSWKSDAQTREDWAKDGWLRLQSQANKLRRQIYDGTVSNLDAARERLYKLTRQIDALSAAAGTGDRSVEVAASLAQEIAVEARVEVEDKLSLSDIAVRLERIESALQAQAKEQKIRPTSGPVVGYRIFVVMPFEDTHVDTYATIRRAASRARGRAVVHRVDEQPGAIVITDEIHRAITEASLVVCDLTDERPNVYYELGFARGVQRPLVCVAREGTRVHFDISGLRILYFKTYESLEERLIREFDLLFAAQADS